ncbi:MAG: DUF748 domain-containing protein [Planctomycetes bacterium]|nr:DUF748 domain-containing protein [Planctomycetota bacterium]
MSANEPASGRPATGSDTPADGAPAAPKDVSPRAARRAAEAAARRARPRKPGRWKRVLVLVLLVFVALRYTVLALLPSIVAGLAASQGLQCTYERLDLSLLGMDVELAHLDLAVADGTDPFLHVEYLRADVAVLALLTGDVIVRRVEIDGLDVDLQRDSAGRFAVLDGMAAMRPQNDEQAADETSASDPAPAPTGDSTPWAPPPLSSPVQLDAVRVQHLHVALRDLSVDPPVQTRLDGNLRLSDLGSDSRPLRVGLTLSAVDVLDQLSLEIDASMPGELLGARLEIHGRGLHPGPLAGYLEPLGVHPVAEAIDLDLTARADLARREGDDPQLSGGVQLTSLRVAADGRDALSSGPLSIEAKRITDREIVLSQVTWAGLLARAEKRPEGHLRVAGLDLLGGPSSPPEETPPSEGEAPALRLGTLTLAAVSLEFLDGSVTPAVPLALRLDALAVHDLDTAPADPEQPVTVDARLLLPGVLSALTLGVRATPFSDHARAAVQLDASGIAPNVLRPYLDAAGIESEFVDGRLALALDAGWDVAADGALSADAHLHDVALSDGDTTLLALGGVTLDRLDLSADGTQIDAGTLEVSGLRASAVNDASGALSIAGLRLLPTRPGAAASGASVAQPDATAANASAAQAPAVPAAASPSPAAPASDAPPPRVHVEALRWTDNQLAFRDESFIPPVELNVSDVGLELTQLALDTDPAATFPLSTDLRAWIRAPGVLEQLELSGAVRPVETGARIDLALRAEGLRPDAAKPVLDAAGIVSELHDGRLALDVGVDLAQHDDALELDVALRDLLLSDGRRELFGLDAVTVDGLRSSPGRLALGTIAIERPRLSAARDARGDLHVLGLRVLALPEPAPVAQVDASGGQPAAHETRAPAPRRTLLARRATSRPAQDATPAPDAAPATPAAPASVTTLDGLALHELTLGWSDASVAPSADLSLLVDADVHGMVLGEAAPPLSLALHARVPEVLDDLSLTGTVQPDPDDLVADLAFVLDGLRKGPLASYLPPDLDLLTSSGRLTFDLDARVSPADGGGQAVHAALTDLAYGDGERSFAKLAQLSADAPRLDAAAGRFEIDSLRLLGLEADVERDVDGRLQLLGLALGPAPSAVAAATGGEEPGAKDEGARGPGGADRVGGAGDATATPGSGADPSGTGTAAGAATSTPTDGAKGPSTPPANAPATSSDLAGLEPLLPDVRLGALEVQVARVTVTDRNTPDATPLEVRDLSLALSEPFTLDGAEPEQSSPLAFTLGGSAAPLLGALRLDARAQPFAADPSVELTFDLEGLRGAGITEAFPALAETLDGSQLEDGRFHAALELHLGGNRRNALDFVPASGLSAELRLSDVAFRDGPDGEVLLGLDELRVEADRILPRRNLVQLGRVEVLRPVARIEKSPEATTVLDLRLLPARPPVHGGSASTLDGEMPAHVGAAAGAPTAAGTGVSAAPADAETAAAGGAGVPAETPLDLRVDELSMSGLDVRYTDTSTYPPLDLPLNDLELLVRGFSTAALSDGSPIKFHLFLGFGTVDDWRTGKPGKAELRPVGEFLVDGRLGLGAHPTGWTKVRLDGVSLPAFAGPARASGVELQDGVLDARAEVRFLDDGSVDTRSEFVFTDLDMSEPDDGPITKWLLLPAPLDTVIFLLRDETGAIHIPLNLALERGQLSLTEITSVATATLGRLIANAVASSPFRVVSTVGDVGMGIGGLLGLVDEDEAATPEPPQQIAYPGASLVLSEAGEATLDTLVERLRDEDDLTVVLHHEMGRADLDEAALRANPPTSDAQAIATGLRQRKLELLEERAQTAARARTASLARMDSEQRGLGRALVEIDRELGLLELSLDHVLDLLRPGAERRAARRTREAALAVAALRLAEVRARLLEAADGDDPEELQAMGERVRVQRPRFVDDPEMPQRGQVVLEFARRRLE